MSIHILIDNHLSSGRLFRLHPFDPMTRATRLMYLAPSIMEYLHNSSERAGLVHVALDSFIGGDEITLSMIPRKAKTAFMGLLAPPENGFWDIRCRDPSPAIRIIGGFSRKDSFVALRHFERRTHTSEADWRESIRLCNDMWAEYFGTEFPIYGVNPSDFISNYRCMD